VAGEHLGAVGLLAARGAEGLPAGVAEVHGVQLLCGQGGGWWWARPQGRPLPACPAALTALAQCRSQLAHCTSSSLSAELSTRNWRSRSTGGSPVPPLTTEGCLWGWRRGGVGTWTGTGWGWGQDRDWDKGRDGMGMRMGTRMGWDQDGEKGDMGWGQECDEDRDRMGTGVGMGWGWGQGWDGDGMGTGPRWG